MRKLVKFYEDLKFQLGFGIDNKSVKKGSSCSKQGYIASNSDEILEELANNTPNIERLTLEQKEIYKNYLRDKHFDTKSGKTVPLLEVQESWLEVIEILESNHETFNFLNGITDEQIVKIMKNGLRE